MTQSQVPATQADMQFANSGLDDMKVSDQVIPRIRIEHKEGMWSDNLTNSRMPTLRFIVLGLVKQRVLFHPNVGGDGNDVPMCKSSDYKMGYPNPDAPREKSFPWDKSGFNPNDFPADPEGNRALPCDGCALKDWGSHPLGNTPYCSEQWTMPIYYDAGVGTGTEEWTPAILTLQKSSIKPIRQYLTAFKSADKPPFMAICNGSLKMTDRGEVTYSIPSFTKEGESDRSRWMEFYEQYSEMREYLTRPPIKDADDDMPPPSENNVNQPPQQQAAPPQADPWQAPPAAGDPWASQPAQQQAPVQQPPQAPPPVQEQQPPAAQPVQAPPPVQQQAPVQTPPPVQEQQPVQQPPQQAPVQTPPPVQEQQPPQQAPVQQPPQAAPQQPTSGQPLPF